MRKHEKLPDFLVIGAMKGGTTSLYNYITQHPNVVRAKRKEVQFFSYFFHRGLSWYKSQFPLLSNPKINQITGEASPYYMFHPHSPKRIKSIMPNTKLIVVLRNPVDRAYSHYNFVRIKSPFKVAIQEEKKRIEDEKRKMLDNPQYFSRFFRRYSLLTRGIYVDQLKAFSSFFEKKQILVLKSEDLFENPQSVMNQVYSFLNLPTHKIMKFKEYNRRKYAPMDPSTRKELVEYFKPHNQRLYEFLGEDLGWDK